MRNLEIRNAISKAGLRQWQIAEAYGVTEFSFSRMLRHELPEETKDRILQIIGQMKNREGT